MMVGRLLSLWDCIFSGAMLNFQGVIKCPSMGILLTKMPPPAVKQNSSEKKMLGTKKNIFPQNGGLTVFHHGRM